MTSKDITKQNLQPTILISLKMRNMRKRDRKKSKFLLLKIEEIQIRNKILNFTS